MMNNRGLSPITFVPYYFYFCLNDALHLNTYATDR
jgi:hypothetical protein